ncbi:hypothetical protein K466DRAFT_67725 [Polyporus arcularius HHB13444]|uniref:Uncharacterized protein n=1 Tax=Polyporus arcularius HHB13444 TaxID=1314778 RepID=A0A5C3PG40_9APHY|nr:hypothetical protein K466DRAFT_67725 [Polyporus arcularius HHB13444]
MRDHSAQVPVRYSAKSKLSVNHAWETRSRNNRCRSRPFRRPRPPPAPFHYRDPSCAYLMGPLSALSVSNHHHHRLASLVVGLGALGARRIAGRVAQRTPRESGPTLAWRRSARARSGTGLATV